MNCTEINTAAEILEAFRACKNPGEQIELFECLATRSDPPVDTFLEILAGVKLEVVVVLTIQAFGKITNADTKVRLKESDGLLTILSQYAQSGATDLIRWMAATTIDIVGFDFIQVSLHLTEEPRKIAENIVQSKVRRFADSNLVDSNDYPEFVRFWIYGALNRLKEISLDCRYGDGSRKTMTCQIVMDYLDLKGIKDVNAALKKAESMGNKAIPIDENEVFEGSAQFIAKKKLEGEVSSSELNILIENQLHCIQSNNLSTRKSAAKVISQLGTNFSEQLKQSQPTLALAVFIFSQDWYYKGSYPDSFSDHQLEHFARQFEILATSLSRKQVRLDCHKWINQALSELEKRRKQEEKRQEIQQQKQGKLEERKQKSIALRNQIESTLNQIRSFDSQQYNNFFSSFRFTSLPNLTLENNETNYNQLFQQHDDNLIDQLRKIDNLWNSHWRSQIEPLQTKKRSFESEESKLSQDLSSKQYQHTPYSMNWWLLYFIICGVIAQLFLSILKIVVNNLPNLDVSVGNWIFGGGSVLLSILSVFPTNFLYNSPIRSLEENLLVNRIKSGTISTQITELYEKQDQVSKLLRPLIK